MTLCIDIDTEAGLARARSRNRSETAKQESRIDEQSIEFHEKVRAAYHELALREPRRFHLIDGHGAPDAIAARVWDEVAAFLQSRAAT